MPPERAVNTQGQLVDVVLSEVDFRRNLKFDFERGAPTYSVDTGATVDLLSDGQIALAHLRAEIKFQPTEEQPHVPFTLAVGLTGVFEMAATEDRADEELEGWVEFNCEHMLWPYLRSHVASLTAAAGMPPLTLYTIGVPKPWLGHRDAEAPAEQAETEAEAASG